MYLFSSKFCLVHIVKSKVNFDNVSSGKISNFFGNINVCTISLHMPNANAKRSFDQSEAI